MPAPTWNYAGDESDDAENHARVPVTSLPPSFKTTMGLLNKMENQATPPMPRP